MTVVPVVLLHRVSLSTSEVHSVYINRCYKIRCVCVCACVRACVLATTCVRMQACVWVLSTTWAQVAPLQHNRMDPLAREQSRLHHSCGDASSRCVSGGSGFRGKVSAGGRRRCLIHLNCQLNFHCGNGSLFSIYLNMV